MLRGATARKLEDVRARFDAAPQRFETDYDFLLGKLVDQATLARAEALARSWGVHPHEVLLATGWVDEKDYAATLAAALDLEFRDKISAGDVDSSHRATSLRGSIGSGLIKSRGPESSFVLAPDRLPPAEIARIAGAIQPERLSLAAPGAVRNAIAAHFADAIAHAAVEELYERRPEQSARSDLASWQVFALAVGATIFAGALLIDVEMAVRALSVAVGFLFVPVIALRLVAFGDLLLHRDAGTRDAPRIPDAELPIYTVLVALYREAKVLPGLVRGLTRLDYPAAKLDIKIVLEACDRETIDAARALDLPGNVEIVVVPDLAPRTKPRALNYALPLSRGEYLVIYDAEDRPERDQLHKALAAFRDGPPNLACLQGRLNLYNADENWLTRQFTIEYSALFDGLLPALDRRGLPFPLGGTSNHFRVSALKWLMAWDPYNVTEDADLGARLARSGYLCRMLDFDHA